jgi:hypothetical protein
MLVVVSRCRRACACRSCLRSFFSSSVSDWRISSLLSSSVLSGMFVFLIEGSIPPSLTLRRLALRHPLSSFQSTVETFALHAWERILRDEDDEGSPEIGKQPSADARAGDNPNRGALEAQDILCCKGKPAPNADSKAVDRKKNDRDRMTCVTAYPRADRESQHAFANHPESE